MVLTRELEKLQGGQHGLKVAEGRGESVQPRRSRTPGLPNE